MNETPARILARRLVDAGLATPDEADSCLGEIDRTVGAGGTPPLLGTMLIERGLVTRDQLTALLGPVEAAAALGSAPPPEAAPDALPERSALASSLASMVRTTRGPEEAPGPPAEAATAARTDPVQAMDDACAATADGVISIPEVKRWTGMAGGDAATLTSALPAPRGAEAFADAVDSTMAGPTSTPPAPAPAPASGGLGVPTGTFGRYQLIGEIARGAMGVVYRAFDPHLRRMVALKVMLSAESPTHEHKRRFQKEALMAARVRHPNIVGVYEVGEVEHRLYYTMELIEGESVQAVLRTMGRLAPRVALKIARDCARALHAAHQQHLIHRDIKPANIMITSRERFRNETAVDDTWIQIGDKRTSSFRVLLTDFGIAKDVTSQTLMTRAGSVVGTPAYMSPEQAGDPDKMSPRSDIYSLGVVLYQCLCGQVPFLDADPVRLLAAVIQRDPPPLRRHAPDLHHDLETIVHKAMMKDAARRYQTAEEFADDIDRYLTGEMIRARPSSLAYRLWRVAVQHREIVLPMAAALVVALSAVFYLAAWPRIAAWAAARKAAAERLERETDARMRLARAEASLAGGAHEEAARQAQELVRLFAVAGKRGEDVGQPEAHDLLSRVHAARGEAGHALLECYRAYRAALGSAGSDRFLLRTVRRLVEQHRYDEALSLSGRLVHSTREDAVAAEAWYWMGRASEGVLDFAGAHARFARALRGYDLPVELRPDAEQHRKFAASLARQVPLPLACNWLTHADVDGDGRKELLLSDRNALVVGTVQAGAFVERARLPVKPGGPFDLWQIWTVGLPDDSRPVIVFAGGDTAKQIGEVHLVRWNGKELEPLASTPTRGGIGAVQAVDIDGDGRRELLVGTLTYERALRWYDWDGDRSALTLRSMTPIGGEVRAIHAVDFDSDGRDEVAVFAAEWGVYGAVVLRWDPNQRALVEAGRTRLGIPDGVVRVDRQDHPPRFVVGVGWERPMSTPLRRLQGDASFESNYAAPGVYVLEPAPDFSFSRRPLIAKSWAQGDQGGATVMRLLGRAGDFLWVKFSGQGVSYGAPDAGLSGAILVYRTGGGAEEFATLLPRPGGPVRLDGPLGILDVDGDGMDELLVSTGHTLTYFDADEGSVADTNPEAAAGSDRPEPLPDWAVRPPLLEFAGDAERVGLTEEALSGFGEAAREARSLPDLRDALLGELRCLVALGRGAEAAQHAETAASRHPPLEVPILEQAVRLLDEADEWAEAARLARRALEAVDLGARQRAELAHQAEVLSGLAAMRQRTVLLGPDAATLDWMATSPLPFRRLEDGSWLVSVASSCNDRLLAPFLNPRESWQLAGTLEAQRHDWAVGVMVGAGSVEPLEPHGPGDFYGIDLDAWGDGNLPVYRLALRSDDPGQLRSEDRLERMQPWDRPLEFELTQAAHRESLILRLRGLDPEGAPRTLRRGALACRGVLWAGLEFTSSPEPGTWGVFRVPRLELRGSSDRLQPQRVNPASAAEHLLLANGRWVDGHTDAARALYDKAIALADLERTKEEAAQRAALPSLWGRGSPNDVVRFCAVDTRFYRGLLRAATGDSPGAQEDLRAAWGLSAERVQKLLQRYCLPLRDRPAERTALRAFWAALTGAPRGENLRQLAAQVFSSFGPDAVDVLLEGVEVAEVACLGIRNVVEGGPAHSAGLRAGDVLCAVEGTAVGTGEELSSAMEKARADGKRDVVLDVLRQGRRIAFPIPPGKLGIEIESIVLPEVRLK